jgi:histidyl-tRNA synthetase
LLQPVRGTHDLLPEIMAKQRLVQEHARRIASLFHFEEMATPIFEFTQVFHRLGESSDVIAKETYTFVDRGGEELTLRPEGTAAVMRAIVSNGLTQNLPLKFLYMGPMFRYDRPQKGRYRQFEQVGAELVGPFSPLADVEVLSFAHELLSALQVRDQVVLRLNTLGDQESRGAYRQALVDYFTPFEKELSEDSKRRLAQNPLRILDSKDKQDHRFLPDVPTFDAYLNQASQDYFAQVCKGLETLGIAYVIDRKLVRGLDYYCHTAFEFVCDTLGAQGTVLAGGRYEGLTGAMGGTDLPGVGWAAGVERLRDLSPLVPEDTPLLYAIPMGDEAESEALIMVQELRRAGFCLEIDTQGNMGKRLKRADKNNAKVVLILGEDEIKNRQVVVKDLGASTQITLERDGLMAYLKETVYTS